MGAGMVNSRLTVVHRRDFHVLGSEDALDQPAGHDVVINNKEGARNDCFAMVLLPYLWRVDPGASWPAERDTQLGRGRIAREALRFSAGAAFVAARHGTRIPQRRTESGGSPFSPTLLNHKNRKER